MAAIPFFWVRHDAFSHPWLCSFSCSKSTHLQILSTLQDTYRNSGSSLIRLSHLSCCSHCLAMKQLLHCPSSFHLFSLQTLSRKPEWFFFTTVKSEPADTLYSVSIVSYILLSTCFAQLTEANQLPPPWNTANLGHVCNHMTLLADVCMALFLSLF